jgi:hypothetical protein
MFASLNTALTTIGTGLVVVGIGGAILAVVVLALMNMWGILDPRMGQAVKGGLVRVALSGALLGSAGGAAAIMGQLGVH